MVVLVNFDISKNLTNSMYIIPTSLVLRRHFFGCLVRGHLMNPANVTGIAPTGLSNPPAPAHQVLYFWESPEGVSTGPQSGWQHLSPLSCPRPSPELRGNEMQG